MLRASACAAIAALALFGGSGCVMHSVHMTTQVFTLPNHIQAAQTESTTVGEETLVEETKSHVFQAGAEQLGIYVHADGRTLAVGGPVDLKIKCSAFGKDAGFTVEWGGLKTDCGGGQLSEQGVEAIKGAVSAAVAGFTGNPAGLLTAGDVRERDFLDIPEAPQE